MSERTPTTDYRVELEAYAGPLDLLLYLVKRHEIDLHDIPMATLTDQYLRHLEVIKAIDVERAGEFLVMAATLLEIKSQMLLPRVAVAQDEQAERDESATDGLADATDPRYELVQQLLAYKRFKDAAIELEHRQEDWSRRLPVHAAAPDEPEPADADAAPRDFELEDLDVMALCEAFANILDSIGRTRDHEVTYDDTPISLHAADIYDRLLRDGPTTLQKIFEGRTDRAEMIGLFLAMLELVRERKVKVLQERIGGAIALEAVPEDRVPTTEEPGTDWRDPETGEVQYDWPDEEARQRAERRKRLRAERLARGEKPDTGDDEDGPGVEFETESLDDMLDDVRAEAAEEGDTADEPGADEPGDDERPDTPR